MSTNFLELAKELSLGSYFIMYTKSETTDGQPIYNARTLEIEGCIGQGDTPELAIQDLREALVDYIEDLLEDGLEVPGPTKLIRTEETSTSITVYPHQNKQVHQRQVQDPMLLKVHI